MDYNNIPRDLYALDLASASINPRPSDVKQSYAEVYTAITVPKDQIKSDQDILENSLSVDAITAVDVCSACEDQDNSGITELANCNDANRTASVVPTTALTRVATVPPKEINFARSQEADLRINITGISSLVVSSVVCHFSTVFRFMCTRQPESVGHLCHGLEHYEYIPVDEAEGSANVAVLYIDSQDSWTQDGGKAMTMVLHAMHGNATELPRIIGTTLMGRIAEFVWTYSCQGVMIPWFRIWLDYPVPINQWLEETLIYNTENLSAQLLLIASAITVAYVLKDHAALTCLSKILLLLIPGDGLLEKQLKGVTLPIRILEHLQTPLLAARTKIITTLSSILTHIYDVYVGKPEPRFSTVIEQLLLKFNWQHPFCTKNVGSCRYATLGRLLSALEERLPCTGFLLAESGSKPLTEIFTGLYKVVGDIRRHDSEMEKHTCFGLGSFLVCITHLVHMEIEVPLQTDSDVSTSSDTTPLTPLVVPSHLLEDLITRYQVLYHDYLFDLFSCPNDGWKYLYFQQWLAEVQGMEKPTVSSLQEMGLVNWKWPENDDWDDSEGDSYDMSTTESD